ncbi:hypothetical protein BH10BDE1_BH10BDE1_16220 [soil metagenome]
MKLMTRISTLAFSLALTSSLVLAGSAAFAQSELNSKEAAKIGREQDRVSSKIHNKKHNNRNS